MPKRSYYVLSQVFFFIVPITFEFYFIYKQISYINLAIFVVIITILGSIWDIQAARHDKKDSIWLWQFNHENTLGIKFFNLPIEEYIFYITSSMFIIFTWEFIKFSISIGNYYALSTLVTWILLGMVLPKLYNR